ncbi:hypothetical protein KIN20_000353 [Parelaphostrongylus tenuis]|uniref:Uncharacterized protein n=1 Tax=Parelaphostrongylus tenuis TaxID=148309 RepID=A0AAD5LSD0_PARTN|nr:hypothetical protein KIN20_000353 [Parelaphostrongylus tenuis]
MDERAMEWSQRECKCLLEDCSNDGRTQLWLTSTICIHGCCVYVMGRKNLRIALAELCKTGKKTANIAKIDKPASVCKTVERFIETGESENHPRNGRPTTLFTPENIQKSLGPNSMQSAAHDMQNGSGR